MCHRQPVTCSAWEMMSTSRRRTTPSSAMTAAGRGTSSASPMWPKLQSLHKVPLTRLRGGAQDGGAKESLELSHGRGAERKWASSLSPLRSVLPMKTRLLPRAPWNMHMDIALSQRMGVTPNRPLLSQSNQTCSVSCISTTAPPTPTSAA